MLVKLSRAVKGRLVEDTPTGRTKPVANIKNYKFCPKDRRNAKKFFDNGETDPRVRLPEWKER